MPRVFSPKLSLLILGVVVASLLVLAEQRFRYGERSLFEVRQWLSGESARRAGAWLPGYQVTTEALPLDGVASDVSALTYDPDRHLLVTLTNKHTQLIELSLAGEVLRRIPLLGFGDPEAIEYVAPGVYIITDERNQRLHKVRLTEQTRQLRAGDGEQLSLSLAEQGNKGYEGSAFDPHSGRLYIAKEREPLRILAVDGFARFDAKEFGLHVSTDPARDARLFLGDLSSLAIDPRTGHLLALSDESRMLLELDAKGRPLSSLSLNAGRHGLKQSIPQAEGVAMDSAGTIYVVSEPNLFYVFSKPRPEVAEALN